jgi:D-glycero-alpha-D-manno-heptose-7-phosphate kinase
LIITQTPLRISLAGGGTDFKEYYQDEEGMVLSTAIDKYVFVIVTERFDEKIYVNYSRKEIVDSVDEIQHELVREALCRAGIKHGVEITMLADIPSEGSGLGSSSSLTVGLLNAFYMFQGEQMPASVLAKEACEIEIDNCGKPIGKQDQYIAAYGGMRQITFRRDDSVDVDKVDLPSKQRRRLSSELMLFYTDVNRKSADILTEQRDQIKNNLENLRNIKRHAQQIRNAIEGGEFNLIGTIMNESWAAKRKLGSKISNAALDDMYEMAVCAGATGGKISGAGGGGFLLLYVPMSKQECVRNAMRSHRELPFMLEQDGSKVIFNFKRYSSR